MDLKSLSQLGRIEKEFELAPGVKIKLHTLSVMDQQKALLDIPEGVAQDESARFLQMQQAILVYATDSVNDEKLTLEQAKELYSGIQYPVLIELFNRYLEAAGEQSKILEELKKK